MYRGASGLSGFIALEPLHMYRSAVPCANVDNNRESKALRWSLALRDYMKERGLTVEQVAETAGRSPGYVSHRTTGRQALSLDIILAVAELTNISERALMIELTDRVGWEPAPESRLGTAPVPSPGQPRDLN